MADVVAVNGGVGFRPGCAMNRCPSCGQSAPDAYLGLIFDWKARTVSREGSPEASQERLRPVRLPTSLLPDAGCACRGPARGFPKASARRLSRGTATCDRLISKKVSTLRGAIAPLGSAIATIRAKGYRLIETAAQAKAHERAATSRRKENRREAVLAHARASGHGESIDDFDRAIGIAVMSNLLWDVPAWEGDSWACPMRRSMRSAKSTVGPSRARSRLNAQWARTVTWPADAEDDAERVRWRDAYTRNVAWRAAHPEPQTHSPRHRAQHIAAHHTTAPPQTP